MSLKGNAEADRIVEGRVSMLKQIRGYSAYEVAVINGFRGTEEEWLASLRGEPGPSGYYVGSDTPPETATLWIDPNGEATKTEEWEFDLDDGTIETRTVFVVD